MLFEQDIWQELRDFTKLTGLRLNWLANKLDIPYVTLSNFHSGKRFLPKKYEARLTSFMEEYRQNNASMLFHPYIFE